MASLRPQAALAFGRAAAHGASTTCDGYFTLGDRADGRLQSLPKCADRRPITVVVRRRR